MSFQFPPILSTRRPTYGCGCGNSDASPWIRIGTSRLSDPPFCSIRRLSPSVADRLTSSSIHRCGLKSNHRSCLNVGWQGVYLERVTTWSSSNLSGWEGVIETDLGWVNHAGSIPSSLPWRKRAWPGRWDCSRAISSKNIAAFSVTLSCVRSMKIGFGSSAFT